MGDVKKKAYVEAIKVLKKCTTNHGFRAAFPGYNGIWARDSVITSLGASLVNKEFKETFKKSLITLGKNQSKHGQIPNAVLNYDKKPKAEYASIDSTLWFIIGHFIYKERYKDSSLFNSQKNSIKKAFLWLEYQDMGEDTLLEQLPTTDWQDAFPHRYGHTINTQALYYKALIFSKDKNAEKLKDIVNNNKNTGLWNGKFYLPWKWKNHNKYQEKGEWFDTLGNLLAIVLGLSSNEMSESILSYIKSNGIEKPYPIKSIYPPIKKGSKDWQDYFSDCDARTQYHYSNAGIWTYIGGFYVLALIKQKKFKEAEVQLNKLAEANLSSSVPFPEWLHGKTGKLILPKKKLLRVAEGNQAWNAGMYILAYESMQKKKCLI